MCCTSKFVIRLLPGAEKTSPDVISEILGWSGPQVLAAFSITEAGGTVDVFVGESTHGISIAKKLMENQIPIRASNE